MSRRRRSRLVFVLLGALLPALVSTGIADAAPIPADDGARILKEYPKSAQMMDVTMRSPALGTDATMRLLLPPGWTKQTSKTWPLVLLLPGCCEPKDYRAWSELTDVVNFAKNKNVIVAMPTGGVNGNFSDWWNFGRYGPPNWEKFHLDEVRQILERNYRAGTKRAVAGLSAGAYGAMEYASRRPGMFQSAAAFSGIANSRNFFGDIAVLYGNSRMKLDPMALWGDPVAQADIWKAHNPYDNAENLRGTRLYLSAGNGFRGPLDPPNYNQYAGLLEAPTLPNSLTFVNKLNRLGIPITTHYYGGGTHHWGYWSYELKRSWPLLTAGF